MNCCAWINVISWIVESKMFYFQPGHNYNGIERKTNWPKNAVKLKVCVCWIDNWIEWCYWQIQQIIQYQKWQITITINSCSLRTWTKPSKPMFKFNEIWYFFESVISFSFIIIALIRWICSKCVFFFLLLCVWICIRFCGGNQDRIKTCFCCVLTNSFVYFVFILQIWSILVKLFKCSEVEIFFKKK